MTMTGGRLLASVSCLIAVSAAQVGCGSFSLQRLALDDAEEVRGVAPCTDAPDHGGIVVRGDAFKLAPAGGGRVGGAVVRSLEHPDRCAVTGEDGAFSLDGFVAREPVTLTIEQPGLAPVQTGTLAVPVPATGFSRLTFQAPRWEIYYLLALAALVWPSSNRCQIATTVTQVGVSMYDAAPSHGEAGATVTIEPEPAGAVGPIYFRYLGAGAIVPDRRLHETTRDGGVLYLNAPPGEYTLTAHKDGVRFTEVRVRCRVGWLVNASPPWGLQALP